MQSVEGFGSAITNPQFFDSFIDMDPDCSSYLNDEMVSSPFVSKLKDDFDTNCRGKGECSISIDYMDLPKKCLDNVMKRAKGSRDKTLFNDYRNRGQSDVEEVENNPPEFFFVS